jgi:hypothetical protein
MGSYDSPTPSKKIKPLSRPPSIQNRANDVTVNTNDLRALALAGILQSSSGGSGAMAGHRQSRGEPEVTSKRSKTPEPMKMGGMIRKTGVYTLHKGEVVVPAIRVKSVDLALKKDKKKPLKK